MRGGPTLALVLAGALGLAGGAQARGHGFHYPRAHGFHAPRAHGKTARISGFAPPRVPAAKTATEGHHRRRGGAEIKELGPSAFHPVKRYKGFSYLEHEKHPEKDD